MLTLCTTSLPECLDDSTGGRGNTVALRLRLPRRLRLRQRHDYDCNIPQHTGISVLDVRIKYTVMLLQRRRADDEYYMRRQCQHAESAHNLRRQASLLAGSYSTA